jgi:tetratricopeptide (TPR) repeat protein
VAPFRGLPHATGSAGGADFEKAIEVNPNVVDARIFLCWALATCPEMGRRDLQRAIEIGEAHVKLMPTNQQAWLDLGVAHYAAGDYDAAISALNKGPEVQPGSRDWWTCFYFAMTHWQLGQKKEAVEWYEKANDRSYLKAYPILQAEHDRLRQQAAELLGIDLNDEDREATEKESSNDEEQSTELETDQR